RPTERLRNTVSYYWQQVNRRTDGTLVNVGRVLRAKLEYQLSRPLFVRVVGQYIQDKTDSLRDDSRTGAPILMTGPGGVTRSAAMRTASSISSASIRLKPAGISLVSVNGPSTIARRPLRTRTALAAVALSSIWESVRRPSWRSSSAWARQSRIFASNCPAGRA